MKNTTENAPTRRPLYRTVLSLAVAALVAAWLPFSVFYVTALNHKPAAQVTSLTYTHGKRIVTTRTSGGQTVRTVAGAGAGGQQQTQTLTPVTTHVS
jgi:hypothetical protein